ncbi:MAG: DctP family TRAP transporter solute-binding subunit [Spirochaetaceae bacterium]|nr:MAG: DctP family TRAP transporter solute-binding subunit [Spirochaetaceae bacterium]
MKKQIILSLILIAVLSTGTLFAAGQREAAAPTGDMPPVRLTWSSASVPGDAHTQAMFEFKRVVEEMSDGQMRVDVHHSAELFTQEAEIAAIRRGNLDMMYGGPPWLAEMVPYLSMLAAPYIFESYEHMTAVMNGPIGQRINDDVAQRTGIRPLGAFYLGTRQLNLRDIGREVRTPADMAGVTLRMPNTPSWLFMGRTLGANPTPLSFPEIYLALQTGTIDAQDNPLPTVRNASFYEVTKYIVLTGHFIEPLMPNINERRWQSLTPRQQEIVLTGIQAAQRLCDELNLQREAERVAYFESKGLTVIVPDRDAFRTHALNMVMNNSQMVDTWDMDLFNEVQAVAEALR